MPAATDMNLIKPRFLIVSDTHREKIDAISSLSYQIVVATHCGDLIEGSALDELRASLRSLVDIRALLKLVIAGNHDFTLKVPVLKDKIANACLGLEPDLVKEVYSDFGEARNLFNDVKSAGVVYLDEGNHQFILGNGTILNVCASPYTLSRGYWGFQYHPTHGHQFGLPHVIMEYTDSRRRAGCPHLFEAVTRACPRLHCFGHIHEGWGAKMVTWRE